jgi:hypothetical protein
MKGITVGFRVDSDGPHTQLAGGTDNAKRDLASVGDEDFREQSEVPYS